MRHRIATAFALGFLVAGVGPADADMLRITAFSPTSGSVGTSVVITGRGFQGVSAVKFNGLNATFTYSSAKKLTATVPVGATTGKITVTKGTTTATSATDFTTGIIPTAGSDWPMFQHDPQHTGKSSASGPTTSVVRESWAYHGVSWVKNEPSIGPDGTVYIGDAKFPLCKLDSAAGTLVWCTNVGGYVNQSSPTIGNPFVKTDAQGTRTVQTVYMGDRNNVFWAIDSEGEPLWHYKINLDGDVRQSPIIGPDPTNTIYMMCGCTTKGVLHAFNPMGTLLWALDLPQVRDASPAGIQFGPHYRLYVGTNNGELFAIDDLGTSGQIAWHLQLAGRDLHSSPSIGPDGTIYVGTSAGLFAVRDNGSSGQVLPGWPVPTAGDIDTAPAISDGEIFVSSYRSGNRTLYAIDATTNPPTTLWSVTGRGSTTTSFAQTPSAVIGGNGFVYAAIGRDIYGFDPASAHPAAAVWHHRLPDDAISLAVGDGVLYVSAKNARLYALVPGP
jgi:IPT/TIG domain/PQQ-like domain